VGIILKHILRNIKENKLRSILIIIALAISTIVMYLNLSIKDDIYEQYKQVLQGRYQDYNILISKNENFTGEEAYFSKADLKLDNSKISEVMYRISTYGNYEYNDEITTVVINGCDRELMVDTNLCTFYEKADDFNTNNEDMVIISKKHMEEYGLKLGDKIKVTTVGGEEEFTIGAIAENKGEFGFNSDTLILLAASEKVNHILGTEDKYSSVLIESDGDGKDVKKIVEADNSDYQAHIVVDRDSIESTLDQIGMIMTIMLLASVVLTFYVISSICRLLMAARNPVVGTFRSVGASKKRMHGILIMENVVYGVIGAVIGIVIGMLLRDTMASSFLGDYAGAVAEKTKYSINIVHILLSVGFAIVLQVAVAYRSVKKASNRPIKDAIFNTVSVRAKVNNKKALLGVILLIVAVLLHVTNVRYNIIMACLAFVTAIVGGVFLVPIITKYFAKFLKRMNEKLFGPAAGLGSRNLSYGKSTISSVVLVTVTVSIMIMIYLMTLSITDVFTSARDTFEGDLQIYGIESQEDFDIVDSLEGIEEKLYLWTTYTETGKLSGDESAFMMLGMNKEMMGIKDLDEKFGSLKEDEILVDEYYAIRNDIKVNDVITIEDESFIQKKLSMKVVGFVDASKFSTQRAVMIINETVYEQKVTKVPYSLVIKTNEDYDIMEDRIKTAFVGKQITIQTVEEFIKNQEDQVGGMVSMIVMLLGASMVLAVFGLINNQLVGFIQRKKEFAVLYSVCMSKGQLRVMILFEAIGTFITGCILGAILSVGLARLMTKMFFSVGMCISTEVNITAMLQLLGITFIVLLLTTISPIRKLNKMNVVDQIKYE